MVGRIVGHAMTLNSINPTSGRIGTALVVLAALAIGSQVEARMPDASQVLKRPYERSAQLGQRVELEDRVVTVTGVRGAGVLATHYGSVSTQGHWVLVTIDYEARREPVSPKTELVAADGRTFGGHNPAVTPCSLSQVGLPRTCTAVFEVPSWALQGARVKVWSRKGDGAEVAVVDLGIDEQQAGQIEADDGTYEGES